MSDFFWPSISPLSVFVARSAGDSAASASGQDWTGPAARTARCRQSRPGRRCWGQSLRRARWRSARSDHWSLPGTGRGWTTWAAHWGSSSRGHWKQESDDCCLLCSDGTNTLLVSNLLILWHTHRAIEKEYLFIFPVKEINSSSVVYTRQGSLFIDYQETERDLPLKEKFMTSNKRIILK